MGDSGGHRIHRHQPGVAFPIPGRRRQSQPRIEPVGLGNQGEHHDEVGENDHDVHVVEAGAESALECHDQQRLDNPARQRNQQPHVEHRAARPEQHDRHDHQEREHDGFTLDRTGIDQVGSIEILRREQVVSDCRQQCGRSCQDNGGKHRHGDPRRRSFGSGRRCRIRPLELDIKKNRQGNRRPLEGREPSCGVDLGAEQSVRGKGTRKRERVRDEKQGRTDVAGGKNGQGSRPKDSGLGVKEGGRDQLAEKHDGVDHRYERIDFPPSNVTHRQYEEGRDEQQGDYGETEPDLPPVRRRIEQPQVVLRHDSPLKASMHRWGSKQPRRLA